MLKFMEHDIGQDPVLFHTLNKHLQDNVAMKSDLEVLRENLTKALGRLKELETTVANNKKAQDKLTSATCKRKGLE